MNPKQKNTLLAAGIVSGLLSLPMTWMTIRNADIKINGGFGDLLDSAFQGMTFDVTGVNGHVTLLFKTPLWFVVAISIAANAVLLMRSSDMFAIPKRALRIVVIGATFWVTVPMINVLLTGDATLGIGALLGLCCGCAVSLPFRTRHKGRKERRQPCRNSGVTTTPTPTSRQTIVKQNWIGSGNHFRI